MNNVFKYKDFIIQVANNNHLNFAEEICVQIEEAAKQRGTGIAKRSPEYIKNKILEGKAVIALYKNKELAGFCYIETWGHDKYVANSGLIIIPDYRKDGLAKQVKKQAFELSRKKFPEAKLFGLTTSLPVMKINSDLGYKPVTFSELTDDEHFWKGCQSCVNYDILTRTSKKHCLCTGMLFDPNEKNKKISEKKKRSNVRTSLTKYERWLRIKRNILFKRFRKNKDALKSIFL